MGWAAGRPRQAGRVQAGYGVLVVLAGDGYLLLSPFSGEERHNSSDCTRPHAQKKRQCSVRAGTGTGEEEKWRAQPTNYLLASNNH